MEQSSSRGSETSDLIEQLETAKMTRSHYRVLLLSGAGVFMDGYDLFIISVALPLIEISFSNRSAFTIALVGSAAILGAVFGAIIFGNLADRVGRRYLFAIDLLLFVVFGALSAFSQSILEIAIFRFLLGIGIGADYPVSASYIAEFVSSKHRGKLIASVFSFQGLGILSAIGVSLILVNTGPDAWRWMLLSGVFPALVALSLRLRMPETPRWYLSHGEKGKAAEVMSKFFGYSVTADQLNTVAERVSARELLNSPYARRVVFTSVSWFLVDIGVYGIGILTPTFILSLYPNKTIATSLETTAILYGFALVGYLSSIALIDIVGRKWIQTIGFFGMAIPLAIAAYILTGVGTFSLAVLFSLLGTFYVLENLGPNTTTWVYPVELFPTRLRGTGHGIAATVGKIGALLGTFVLPFVLVNLGQAAFLAVVSGVCLAGALLTIVLGTETKQLSLDDVSEIFKSFYDMFDKISANILATAEKFNFAMEKANAQGGSFDPVVLAEEVKKLEHNGDDLVHDAFTKLAKKFVAPIDRQDITSLLKVLDDMTDLIDAAVSRLEVYHISHATPEIVRFSKIILSQAQAVRQAILSLKGRAAQVVVSDAALKIDSLENEADALLRECLGTMFEAEEKGGEAAISAFQIMKMKEIYESLERTTDKAEDVADILRNLLINYSL